ncbi:hypothetical protein AADW59_00625 [Candidatus Hodgkinia cicadicola]
MSSRRSFELLASLLFDELKSQPMRSLSLTLPSGNVRQREATLVSSRLLKVSALS